MFQECHEVSEVVTICQMCGDKGFSVALVYCDECREYAVHHYCLDTLPASFDEYVVWLCYDCESKAAKSSSLDKSHPPLLGESGHKSLKGVKVKRKNCAKRLKKKSKEKVTDCSLHNSGFQRPPSSFSSSQLHEVCCSEIAEKILQPGQESRLGEGGSLEVAEDSEASKHSQLAFSDNHLPELDCCKNGEKDQNHQAVNRLNEDGLHNVAETLKKKSSQLAVYVQPNDTKCSVDDDKDQWLAIQNDSEEPSFRENDDEALSSENSKLTGCYLQPLRAYSLEDGERAWKPGNERPLDKSLYDEKEDYHQAENSQLVISDTLDAPEQGLYVHAQPIKDPVWRGGMNIFKQKFGTDGGLVAHLSRIACPKVRKEADSLPRILSPELLPRLSVWPKSFLECGPSYESIALYFFPDNERNEKVFDCLVNDMISQDLAMRVVTENAELLMFSSKTLPLELWRFQMKFYLWGVFRGNQSLAMAEDESGLQRAIAWHPSTQS